MKILVNKATFYKEIFKFDKDKLYITSGGEIKAYVDGTPVYTDDTITPGDWIYVQEGLPDRKIEI